MPLCGVKQSQTAQQPDGQFRCFIASCAFVIMLNLSLSWLRLGLFSRLCVRLCLGRALASERFDEHGVCLFVQPADDRHQRSLLSSPACYHCNHTDSSCVKV